MGRSRRTRGYAVPVLAALLALPLTACDDPPQPEASAPETLTVEVPTVPAAQGPLSDDGGWWAGGVLHVGDRREAVGRVLSFAVADRTVAFLDQKSRLCFTDLQGAECSSLTAYGDPVVSPDGDRLGFLEASRGRRDEYGYHRLTTVVVDLDSGAVLLASAAGMGDPRDDDLGALYSDAEPAFLGFTEAGEAIVRPASDEDGRDALVLPLYNRGDREDPDPGGSEDEVRGARRDDLARRDLPGSIVRVARRGRTVTPRAGVVRSSDEEGQVSPDGSAVLTGPIGVPGGLDSAPAAGGSLQRFTGQRGRWWSFGAWTGPHAFLAGTRDPGQTTYRVNRCDAVARSCTQVDQVPSETPRFEAVVFPTTVASDAESISSP